MKHFYSKFLSLSFAVAGFVLTSAQYSNGYIVANEGNYGSPTGEISYIDANNNVTNNVYHLANNDEALGDILQSIYFNGDKSYLVLNNSNKVVVTNRASFVKSAEITNNIVQPRYTTIANGKIYTSNWGTSSAHVSVHNATTLAYITSIPLSENPEEIVTVNGKVYVNKSSYRAGNSIEVIDPSTDTIIKTITLSSGLQSITVIGNDIFALCTGLTGSTVYKINTTTDTVAASIANATVVPPSDYEALKFTSDATKLYIAGVTSVYSLNTDLATFSSTPIFTTTPSTSYGDFYGFAAIDGKIFQGNANSFGPSSTVNVYSLTGTLLNTFSTTIGANNVYKNLFTPANLAIAENKLSNAISIYPNPVSDVLYIKNADAASYQIVDISGKLVKAGTYKNGIAISDLNKGAYIIQISVKNTQKTEKFIVK
ncbi:hypothetical protein ASG22_15460 [Chryseobacterium sp. Leaf405]|uniref:T9SS type A sorting domain-containing protein n=1 Tax=Chryseobacterium sp. Leaf405 TaxID=1736367 RepID=UPI0006FCEC2E|nr:DUF5074 domain-containing protein [Chryseobacterium sp. Leaf405]KQT21551.1 hypothetical protein ASG22_15460 [Chryseobacterium sp. Leaf405]